MITTVSLNPSIDKSAEIAEFKYGSMNRVIKTRLDAGGKAINLSYVARVLGLEVLCAGFARENGADIIRNRLEPMGVKTDFITLPGSIRTNLKLRDLSTGLVTEVNEAGEPVDKDSLEKAREMILGYSRKSDFLVLTGSLPSGCPKSFYAEIIRDAKCKCVLDCEGESLALGIAQRPYLIKPNRMELEMLVGRALESLAQVRDAAVSLCRKGVSVAAVSLGNEGALTTDGTDSFYAPPVKLHVNSTVGAGDSMVAGFLSALSEGAGLCETLKRGAACASASITRSGTQLMDFDTYKAILNTITIERM